eukprot:CAMPEP_0177655586 /NCGR_PEP_ID=MMETSP0447-20121125/15061_1 /TAXON_ID=0 /ORGANISM="Stygamoeba regulata, Strain BSH-02190019" /LENGTH=237 /DNA_ID=CAMNT_0019159545 /DNA_START=14 /DNA_END=727 /DNA_ORIENTATION=+
MSSSAPSHALTLYSYWRSSCSWRVRLTLAHKALAYNYEAVHLVREGGQQFAPTYAGLNPMHQVPTLIHELCDKESESGPSSATKAPQKVCISQSVAICNYLEEQFPDAPSIYPKDVIARAKVREIVDTITSGIQPLQNLAVLRKVGLDKKIEWGGHWIDIGFQAVEKLLEKSAGKYCVGDSVSLADFCLVPQVYNARRFEVDLSKFPIISRIEKDLAELDIFKQAHPNAQPDAEEAA